MPDCSCGEGTHSAAHVLDVCLFGTDTRNIIQRIGGLNSQSCGQTIIHLFKNKRRYFARINQLLRQLQLHSPPSENDIFEPP